MSRHSNIDSPGQRVAAKAAITLLTAALLLVPGTAFADVLEISGGSYGWIAGGPAVASAATADPGNAPVAALAASAQSHPVTHVAATAGPAYWQGRIAALAAKYDLSPALLEAVVWQESRWRPHARSPAGARGLAQLMPGTARQMGVDIDDPDANLEGGVRYLRMQLDTFGGDLEKALAAYNAGPGRVHKARGIPPIRETQNYVASILARLSEPVRRK